MEQLVFADGDRIGVIEDGAVTYYESDYIVRYKRYLETKKRNDEWKISGEGARFRGDAEALSAPAERVDAFINGVDWDGDKIVYCFSVNGSSGVYRKPLGEKLPEEHILSSSDAEILSVNVFGGLIAVTVRSDDVTSQIGTLDARSSELRTLTDGDARDANAVFSDDPAVLLFDSAGVGRTADGSFSGKYAPSVLYALNRETLELTELRRGAESYVKPSRRGGALYCIARPNREKGNGNLFLDIVLFPFRLVKAFFGMLQAFTVLFGNTSLTSDTGMGENPTRGRKQDAKKLYVDGRRIEADKEMKRNRKFKDREYGFIPASWKLIRCGEKEEVLARGVCDYDIGDDGALYYTDGRHIYRRRGGKEEKLADTTCCLALAVRRTRGSDGGDLFE